MAVYTHYKKSWLGRKSSAWESASRRKVSRSWEKGRREKGKKRGGEKDKLLPDLGVFCLSVFLTDAVTHVSGSCSFSSLVLRSDFIVSILKDSMLKKQTL